MMYREKHIRFHYRKVGRSATPFQVGELDHGHLKFSSSFTKLCCSRIGPEVNSSSSSFEACDNEQPAQHCSIMGPYFKN